MRARFLAKKKGISILIDKFINLLVRNGKKSKSNKLITNCSIYTDKLLKKNFLVYKPLRKLPQMMKENKLWAYDAPRTPNPWKIDPSNGEKSRRAAGPFDRGARFTPQQTFIENDVFDLFSLSRKRKGVHMSSHYRLKNFLPPFGGVADLQINRGRFSQINKKKSIKTAVGTKSRQTDIFLSSLFTTKMFKKVFLSPPVFFQKSISRVRPLISLQKLRKGGRTKYIPRALAEKKGMARAIKWIINSSMKRYTRESRFNKKTAPISQSISNELWECFLEQGNSWQKKEELHKLGAANKAFVRYNWW